MKKIGNFLGGGLAVIAKKLYKLTFNKIKDNLTDFLCASPIESVKIFYGICIISFFVSIAASGATLLAIGSIVSIAQLAGPEINKPALIGELILYTGVAFMAISFILIGLIGATIYIKVKTISGKITRKIK